MESHDMRFAVGSTALLLLAVLGCQDAAQEGAVDSSNSPIVRSENHQEHQDHKDTQLNPGDRVEPRLVEEIHWTPGRRGSLEVEITATDKSGELRLLDYEAVGEANPVAEINFLDGDLNYHSLKYVKLADRSGEGVYSAEFELPAGARGADVIVRVELGRDDVTVEPLEIKGIPIEFDLLFGGSRSQD